MSCATKSFGVIGLGVWGQTHLITYSSSPFADLVCVCDKNEELLESRQQEYSVPHATTDYTELLSRADIDAVSVVTPDFLHREVAVAACEAGKHVLIEKPMATTVADAQVIADAAKANGVTLMVDFHNRWNPAMYAIKSAIEAGEVGEPQMMTLRLNDTIYVPTGMLSWGGASTVIWFLGSHSIDLVRWLFDDEVTRVYSVSRSRVLAERGINTPDFFHTICELKGGGVAHIENCWIMSDAMPTVFDFKAEFVGSEGTMFADVSSHRMVQEFSSSELQPFSSTPGSAYLDVVAATDVQGKPGGFAVESILHFVDCIVNDKQPIVDPDDGVNNTRVLVAIHESAASGQPVDVAY